MSQRDGRVAVQGLESRGFEVRLGRLTQLLLLAVTVLVYSVMAIAIANSLFVSQVGAARLPIAFMLIGLCSILAYAGFSQIVDRYSRPQLFQGMLVFSSLLMVGLWGLLRLDTVLVYYGLLIAAFFQWDFYNNILYPSLLTDYFTTLEYKQYAPYIGIAQAGGTLLGGGLTALLSQVLSTRDLLLCLPGVFAIAILQLLYLDSTQRRLDAAKKSAHAGVLETLKAVPDLVKRYPLILFLAASSFLLVMIYTTSEFLWFSIYGQFFQGDDLTGLLGLMRIVISLVQVGVLYLFTRPLLHWLGVARMNPVYPLTTLLSFVGLVLNLNLPAAIALQVNGDALYKSINLPVHQLNYNAIPREFMGRVRTLSDGIIYAMGLTLAGMLLWICEQSLSLGQITVLAGALTLLLLAVRVPMGRFYAQGLEDMIRAGTLDLNAFGEDQDYLPPQSSEVIRELLTNRDQYTQLKGLELAGYTENPSQFLPEVLALLPADGQRLERIVQLFSHESCPLEDLQPFTELLTADQPLLQTTALEVLMANPRYTFSEAQIQQLEQTPLPAVRSLTQIIRHGCQRDDIRWPVFTAEALTPTVMESLVRIFRANQRQEWVPLVEHILPLAAPEMKCKSLEALIPLAHPGNIRLTELALGELKHSDPNVRVCALKLLQRTVCEESLEPVAEGLSDPDPRVRQQVAQTLAAFRQQGLALARKQLLATHDPATIDTAIAAIGQVQTRAASDILYGYLSPDFQQIPTTRKWQQQIPENDPDLQLLAVAIANYHQRLIYKVLYVLSCLGYARTVNTVTQILAMTDPTDLANAVEVLVSLRHRRFVLPLIPLLEQAVTPVANPKAKRPAAVSLPWLRTKGYKILLAAMESQDRWIRAGALVALSRVPSALMEDSDPVVQSMARQLLPARDPLAIAPPQPMNRLLLLKDVALFKNLSLDELWLIEQALEQAQVFKGETIFTEGSWGSHLYIVASGRVQLVKQVEGAQHNLKQVTAGGYFGEIALFDDAPRWNGAIAIEDSLLLKLEKNRFISLITQRPHIVLELCRFLSQQLRETDSFRSWQPTGGENSPCLH